MPTMRVRPARALGRVLRHPRQARPRAAGSIGHDAHGAFGKLQSYGVVPAARCRFSHAVSGVRPTSKTRPRPRPSAVPRRHGRWIPVASSQTAADWAAVDATGRAATEAEARLLSSLTGSGGSRDLLLGPWWWRRATSRRALGQADRDVRGRPRHARSTRFAMASRHDPHRASGRGKAAEGCRGTQNTRTSQDGMTVPGQGTRQNLYGSLPLLYTHGGGDLLTSFSPHQVRQSCDQSYSSPTSLGLLPTTQQVRLASNAEASATV